MFLYLGEAVVGILLVYAAIKDEDPRKVVHDWFSPATKKPGTGGTVPPSRNTIPATPPPGTPTVRI